MTDLNMLPTQLQSQKQLLSLKQRQALELLHLPLLELEQHLTEELAANPLLEELPPPEPGDGAEPETPRDTPDEDSWPEEGIYGGDEDEWREELPLPPELPAGSREEIAEERMLSSAAPPPSLTEQLQLELNAMTLPSAQRGAVEKILESLDDNGYLGTSLPDIAMSSPWKLPELESALALLQQIAPPGVGARNLAECLKLQLEQRGRFTPVMKKLLEEGLPLLERNQLPQLAQLLKISPEELKKMLEELRQLDPAPGASFSRNPVGVVLPDLEIFFDEESGRYDARLCKENRRRIILAPHYEKLLEETTLSPEDRSYLKEKQKRARELIAALEMRGSTLLQLGRFIAGEQREFFESGVKSLRPCTMKQAGEKLHLHEATISRAAAGKYAVTPQGVLPLKFFFSSGVVSQEGESVSSVAVMERLRELISEEDPFHPLSDDQLAKNLSAEGIKIARRTVAKYRDLQKIPAASLRKQHR